MEDVAGLPARPDLRVVKPDLLHKAEKPAIHSVMLPAAILDQIEAAKIRLAAVHRLMDEILQPGIDYDLIQGTDKPTLLKPGAEILAQAFSLTEKYSILHHVVDLDRTPPFIQWAVQCDLYNRDSGSHVGQGVGGANSYEDKYRWRWQGRGEQRHRVENTETMTLDNTLLKMAKKRAFVDAVLTVTGASRLFTQDLEDLGLDQEEEDDRKASPSQLDFLRKMGSAKKGLKNDAALLGWATTQLRKSVSALQDLTRNDASALLDILLGKSEKAEPNTADQASGNEPEPTPTKEEQTAKAPAPAAKGKAGLYPKGQQPVADGQYEVVEAPQSRSDDSRGAFASCKARLVTKVDDGSPIKVGDTFVLWTAPGDQGTHDALMKATMGSAIVVKGLLADAKGNVKVTEVGAAQAVAPAAKTESNARAVASAAPAAAPAAEGDQEIVADLILKSAAQAVSAERGPAAYAVGSLVAGIVGGYNEAPKGDYHVWALTPEMVAKLQGLRVGQRFGVEGRLRVTKAARNLRAEAITVYEA